LLSGVGQGTFSLFKKECGINQKLFIKNMTNKLVVKVLFARFLAPVNIQATKRLKKSAIRANFFLL